MRPRKLTIGRAEPLYFERTTLGIPNEILFTIIDQLVADVHPRAYTFAPDVRATLCSLCVVNKVVGRHATKYLYRLVSLPTNDIFFQFMEGITAEGEPKVVRSLAVQCRPWMIPELFRSRQNTLTSLRILLQAVALTLQRLDMTTFDAAPDFAFTSREADPARDVLLEELPRLSALEEFSNVSDYYDVLARRGQVVVRRFNSVRRLVLYDPCFANHSGCIRLQSLPLAQSVTFIFLKGVQWGQGSRLTACLPYCGAALSEVNILTLYHHWSNGDRSTWDIEVLARLVAYAQNKPAVRVSLASIEVPPFLDPAERHRWALEGIREARLSDLTLKQLK